MALRVLQLDFEEGIPSWAIHPSHAEKKQKGKNRVSPSEERRRPFYEFFELLHSL